jgi:hypothetical protein
MDDAVWGANAVENFEVVPLLLVSIGRDVHDSDHHWAEGCGIAADGALLVATQGASAKGRRDLPRHTPIEL